MERRLLYALVGLLSIGTLCTAEQNGAKPELTCTQEETPGRTIREHIIEQLHKLDFMLENVGQALYNYRISVSNKKAAIAYMIQAREAIKALILEETSYTDCSLLYRQRKLIDIIAAALESDFSKTEEPSYTIDESLVDEIDAKSIRVELAHRDQRINLLTSYSEVLGLSYLNVFSRSLSDFGKESGLTNATARLLPYIALGGGIYSLNKLIGSGKVTAQNLDDAKKTKAIDGGNQLYNLFGTHIGYTPLVLDLGIIYTLAASTLKDDFKDVTKYANQWFNWIVTKCKGEFYDDGTGFRKLPMIFGEVIGAHGAKAELMSVVDYFKDKSAIDRIGAPIERSFFLAGPMDTSKSLAYATAGEISLVLQSQGKSSECSVYEVHASTLIQKSLKDILKEAEKYTPCIVVLEEINLLHEYGIRKMKANIWSDLITTMNSLSRSKKDVFVITTAAHDRFDSHEALSRYGIFAKVENPTHEDRLIFFKRELERRSVPLVYFDLNALAQKTEKYTFAQLMNVLKRACAQALSLRKSLSQEILEEAIAAKESRVPGKISTVNR